MNTDLFEQARNVALRYLGYAARSTSEMEKRLLRDDYAPEIIAAILEEFVARGWLDDAAFAQHWVEDRADRKKYGKTRLAAELRRRGIDADTVDTALETVDSDKEKERALSAARTRWKPDRLEGADRVTLQAEKRRLSDFLQRRGFGWSVISAVLKELEAETDL